MLVTGNFVFGDEATSVLVYYIRLLTYGMNYFLVSVGILYVEDKNSHVLLLSFVTWLNN